MSTSPTSTGFDLKSVSTSNEDAGIEIHVKDASGERMYFGEGEAQRPVTIRVAGTYSKAYRAAVDAQRDRLVKQRRTSLTGEQLGRQQLELTAACVLSWQGFVAGADPCPCTKENVIAVLQAAPWIREQVEETASDHAAFFSTSSAT